MARTGDVDRPAQLDGTGAQDLLDHAEAVGALGTEVLQLVDGDAHGGAFVQCHDVEQRRIEAVRRSGNVDRRAIAKEPVAVRRDLSVRNRTRLRPRPADEGMKRAARHGARAVGRDQEEFLGRIAGGRRGAAQRRCEDVLQGSGILRSTKVALVGTVPAAVQSARVLERGAELVDLLRLELHLIAHASDRSARRQRGDERHQAGPRPAQLDLDDLSWADGEQSRGAGGQQPGRDEGRGHAPANSISVHTTPSGWPRSAFTLPS